MEGEERADHPPRGASYLKERGGGTTPPPSPGRQSSPDEGGPRPPPRGGGGKGSLELPPGAANLRYKGQASADRNNKATLPRTAPRTLFKSSAKDLNPPSV